MSKEVGKKKKGFQMPHLLWIMLGLLLTASIATYLIPAGEFATTAEGVIIGDQFSYLGRQTPVSPADLSMLILDGLVNSSAIIFAVMVSGATINLLLQTGSIDNILNWAIFKLQDKGQNILISLLFILVTYIGGFAGSDALIALVPVGVIFSKKLKLDPLVAIGVTTFPALIGFGTGPNTPMIPQIMIGLPPYSGFLVRFVIMNLFMVLGLLYVIRYIRRIQADPTNSIMYSEGWTPESYAAVDADEAEIEGEKLEWRSVLSLLVFISQYFFIIYYSTTGGASVLNFMIAAGFVTAILIGLISKLNADEVGNAIAGGFANMAFVGVIIGLAGVMSLILNQGNIMDTIIYNMTLPLQNISSAWSTIGVAGIVGLLNPLIPSATSKAAFLIPILEPIGEALEIHPQLIIQAFQFGDGFTNLVSPVLGWTVGSAVTANVPFDKWVRWVAPVVAGFFAIAIIILFILSNVGWTGV